MSLSEFFHSGIPYLVVSAFYVVASVVFLAIFYKLYKKVADIRNLVLIRLVNDQKVLRHIREQVAEDFKFE